MSIYELFLISVLPMLFASIGGYVAYQTIKKQAMSMLKNAFPDLLGATVDTFINELKTNKELQQAIFFTGQIIGNGAKQGAFSGAKGRGKGGLEQLLIEGIMGFVGNKTGIGQQQSTQTTDTSMGIE
jgi:hypothetical protein